MGALRLKAPKDNSRPRGYYVSTEQPSSNGRIAGPPEVGGLGVALHDRGEKGGRGGKDAA